MGRNHPTGMPHIERHTTTEHEHRVQTVQVGLGSLKRAALTPSKFRNPKDRSNHNEKRGEVENIDKLSPGQVGSDTGSRRVLENPIVKDGYHRNEASEEDDLNRQADKDDVLAAVQSAFAICASENSTTFKLLAQFMCKRYAWGKRSYLPMHWMAKEKMSPKTKILVNHLVEISERCSPSKTRMIRPNIM